jgi:hypothetical protein
VRRLLHGRVGRISKLLRKGFQENRKEIQGKRKEIQGKRKEIQGLFFEKVSVPNVLRDSLNRSVAAFA